MRLNRKRGNGRSSTGRSSGRSMLTRHAVLALGFAALALAVPQTAQAQDAKTRKVQVNVAASQLIRLGGNIVRVSTGNSDIANVAAFKPDQVLITGKRAGNTVATVWTSATEAQLVEIHVTYPAKAIRSALKKAIPNATKIAVSSAGASLLLSGEVPSVADVARAEKIVRGIMLGVTGSSEMPLVNMLKVPGNQQVQLEVSFAEVSRSALRQIGFNFWSKDMSGSKGYAGGVIAPQSSLSNMSPELSSTPDLANLNHGQTGFDPDTGSAISKTVPLIAAPISGAFGFVFSSTLGGFPFSGALSLLSRRGYARTMAEPTLVAMSGKSATFLAGGEFPIPLPQSLGQVAVEYRKFGIQLSFTPTVLGKDIQMKLAMTVSDVDQSLGVRLASTNVPGLTTRHSETTIRLRDGQSFVIAGLLSDKVRSSVDKVPWLGDIPIIGSLFRSSSYRRDETELLVVVTAHLVRPLNEKPKMPGENEVSDPSDLELFWLGKHESLDDGQKNRRRSRRRNKRKPAGAVGFKR